MKSKVVILCGGLGTRLKEETEFRPKPLVPIGTQPILWHIMKLYAHYGFDDFVLCLGYKSESIKEYFCNYEIINNNFTLVLGSHNDIQFHNKHSEAGWRITFADTGLTARKGARLKRIEKFIDTDIFMCTYGDGVSNVNISDLLKFHVRHKKLATITGVRPPSRFGELIIKNNRVERFSEKPQTSEGFINGGFFVFNRKVLRVLDDSDECDLEFGLFEDLAIKHQLMVYKHTGFWYCMDNVRDMDHLNKLWTESGAPWKVWK